MDQRLEFLTTGSCSSNKPQVVLGLNHYFSQPHILPYYLKLILEGAHRELLVGYTDRLNDVPTMEGNVTIIAFSSASVENNLSVLLFYCSLYYVCNIPLFDSIYSPSHQCLVIIISHI